VNKLRKKAKLVIGERVDVFFADEDEGTLATAAALGANEATLAKAKMVPLPLSARSPHAAEIATDVAPTPFGSKSLRVTLCRPTPVLADEAYAKAVNERGQPQADALAHLVSTLRPADKDLDGSLDGTPFSLKLGVDFFPDATAKATNASAAKK